MRVVLGAVAAVAIGGSPVRAADSPPVGVYGCYDQRMVANAPGCIRTGNLCMGLQFTLMPVVMFGLIDGSTYADYDGNRGHYSYDMAGGVLTMRDGSRQAWHYHKVADWSFRLIDNRTGENIYTCPLQAEKNPAHGPW